MVLRHIISLMGIAGDQSLKKIVIYIMLFMTSELTRVTSSDVATCVSEWKTEFPQDCWNIANYLQCKSGDCESQKDRGSITATLVNIGGYQRYYYWHFHSCYLVSDVAHDSKAPTANIQDLRAAVVFISNLCNKRLQSSYVTVRPGTENVETVKFLHKHNKDGTPIPKLLKIEPYKNGKFSLITPEHLPIGSRRLKIYNETTYSKYAGESGFNNRKLLVNPQRLFSPAGLFTDVSQTIVGLLIPGTRFAIILQQYVGQQYYRLHDINSITYSLRGAMENGLAEYARYPYTLFGAINGNVLSQITMAYDRSGALNLQPGQAEFFASENTLDKMLTAIKTLVVYASNMNDLSDFSDYQTNGARIWTMPVGTEIAELNEFSVLYLSQTLPLVNRGADAFRDAIGDLSDVISQASIIALGIISRTQE